jgi:hypothetical protein
MIRSLITLMSLLALVVTAQEKRPVYLGITGGSNLSRQFNSHDGYSQDRKSPPGIGWNLGMTSEVDLIPALSVLPTLTFVTDAAETERTIFSNVTLKTKLKNSWVEGGTRFLYKPLRRASFGLIVGAGVSARRLIRSVLSSEIPNVSGGQSSWSEYDVTDLMFAWSYFLSPQLGAEFYLPDGGRLLGLAHYQYALRELYKPVEPNPNATFDYAWERSHYKPIAGGLTVSWLWALKPRHK